MGNVAATFEERLEALDSSIRSRDLKAAGTNYEELRVYVAGLSANERENLELSAPAAWDVARRNELKLRWEVLCATSGSWSGWCDLLRKSGRQEEEDPSFEKKLRLGARDMVYVEGPGEHRSDLWRFCAGCKDLDQDSFIKEIENLQGEDTDKEDVEQIWLDVMRTPSLKGDQQATAVRILRVLGARQRGACQGEACNSVQYVQGMHMLVCCPLWVGFSEVETLQIAEFVLGGLCAGYYNDRDFSAFRRDVYVVETLIHERLPQLAEAMKAAGVPIQVLTFDPLLCLFTHHLPATSAMRLWDVLLVEGDVAIFALMLALLERVVYEFAGPATEVNISNLNRQLGTLNITDAEDVVARARDLVYGSGTEEKGSHIDLRKRLNDLRNEASMQSSPPAWYDVVSQLQSWWGRTT